MTNQATLPESVRRQVEEAEALEKQLYGEPTPEGNTEPSPEPDPVPEPVPEPAPTPETTAVTQPEGFADEEESFRRRYEVLQGKYSAEVPRLHAQLREANERMNSMQAEFSAIKEQLAQKPVTQDRPDNDAETFGEDLVDAIDRRAERKAQSLVAAELKPLQDYVRKLEAQLGSVNDSVQSSAQDVFLNKLAVQVPDYEATNVDQGFLAWLGESDPVYGVPRQAALDDAVRNLDVSRTASIFQAYNLLTRKQVATHKQQETRKELERQVAPKTNTPASQVPQSERIWTLGEWEAAQDPRNIYKMGRAESDALAAEAERALVEGRVR